MRKGVVIREGVITEESIRPLLVRGIVKVAQAEEEVRHLISTFIEQFAPGIDDYHKAVRHALAAEFVRIEATPEEIEHYCFSLNRSADLGLSADEFIKKPT